MTVDKDKRRLSPNFNSLDPKNLKRTRYSWIGKCKILDFYGHEVLEPRDPLENTTNPKE